MLRSASCWNKAHNFHASETPDKVQSHFIKKTHRSLTAPLRIVFERSLSCCVLPKQWKTAVVTPILKKPPAATVGNYRPISLTSSVCKVFEIMINKTLLNYVIEVGLLNTSQFGFLPGRSTLSQLLVCTNDWMSALNDRIQTEVVYIDIAKAFDTVCFGKLLHKLGGYGVSGSLLKWIRAFLCDRTFRVKVGNSYSRDYLISSGVPQGSLLGPFLFLLYINDAPERLSSICKLFADDLKIYRPLRDPDRDLQILQDDLDLFCEWTKAWQLSISIEKCQVLYVNCRQDTELRLGDYTLSDVETTIRDLVVQVRADLSPDIQCKQIVEKSSRVILILRLLQHQCLDHYRKAFIVYCRPILEYCSHVWSPYKRKHIKQLESVQRTFTRIAFRKVIPGPFSPSYHVRLKIFQLKSLEYRRLELDLTMCYRIVHGFSDIDFNSMFSFAPCRARRSTHHYVLCRKGCSANSVFYSFPFRVIRTWNKLPPKVVEARNVSTFKKRLTDFDLHKISSLTF